MELTPDPMPPGLAEACGETLLAMPGFQKVLGCVACVLSRSKAGDERALISSPAIEACTGLDHNTTYRVLLGLEIAGDLLETYRPETTWQPASGKWANSLTRYFKPTEIGSEILPTETQKSCQCAILSYALPLFNKKSSTARGAY